jgi:hypothetical protein
VVIVPFSLVSGSIWPTNPRVLAATGPGQPWALNASTRAALEVQGPRAIAVATPIIIATALQGAPPKGPAFCFLNYGNGSKYPDVRAIF